MATKERVGTALRGFSDLGPDRVLNLVEKELGLGLTNLFRPMNSYINRVYELQDESGRFLMAKFYRPGRWSGEAISDEHRFLLDLKKAEVPVIAPLELRNGQTLAAEEGLYFAVFPKCGGRCLDEFTDDQWLQLGRLLGRTHGVGSGRVAKARQVMHPAVGRSTLQNHLEYLERASFIPGDLKQDLSLLVREMVELVIPAFEEVELIRIHGDCHFANIIHRPDEGFFLIDFDDMVMGPPVQDLWMLLPGGARESLVELDLLLEGYETFCPFDRRSLSLIEVLRGMRFLHYMAWCGRQMAEDGQTRVVENFGSREYWSQEIADLEDQKQRIVKSLSEPFGNIP